MIIFIRNVGISFENPLLDVPFLEYFITLYLLGTNSMITRFNCIILASESAAVM